MDDRARILVIDDDPLFRNLLSSFLQKEYSVVLACEGSEGFYRALEQPPEMAIVDIQMPGWDGLKTLKAFRSHPLLSQVKIVILTSDASKETVLAAIHGGADDYVIKTVITKDGLLKKINNLLPVTTVATEEQAPPDPGTGAVVYRGESVEETIADGSAGAPSAPAVQPLPVEDAELQEIMDAWE